MSSGRIDPNTMAAFLEGRLDEAERAAVIAQLNESPEDYEAFAEAAAALHELETAPGDVIPLAPVRTRTRPHPAWLALPVAAGLAALLLLRPFGGSGQLDGRAVLALADDAVAAAAAQTWATPGWSVTRGAIADLDGSALEFRIGARVAARELAHTRGDSDAARALAGELTALLRGVAGGGLLEGAAAASEIDAALGRSPWYHLGLWTEAAQAAARARHGEFFDQDARDALEAIVQRLGADAPADARALLDAAWPPASAATLAALERSLMALIEAAAD